MTKQVFKINYLTQLPEVASVLIGMLQKSPIMAFYGEMGAGKTTLIKEICHQLGITDQASSPTFSIVNEYADSKGNIIYHFDFYRITRLEEAFDIGYEYYFYSGFPCLIEWPDKIEQLLPKLFVKVSISTTDGHEGRLIEAEMPIT